MVLKVQMFKFIILVMIPICWSFRCDRIPEGRIPPQSTPDETFEVKISGNPTLYVPNQVYTVSIEAKQTRDSTNHFSEFMLVAQPKDNSQVSLGSFELSDSLSKYNDRCRNSIIQSSLVSKTNIQVFWKAPPPGSGCVTIKATVVENKDRWYKDGPWLNKDLCEDTAKSSDSQNEIVEKCCACDEAKYEVVFEGLWSRQTHPKNFPNNSWEAKFSDVIGASHSIEYQFWQSGKPASDGLHEVAANGTTKMLEAEFKNVSNHIRTIIKARGINYPNVTAKTFAVFRVNNKHHLISLVSKIIPSPDWFVGIPSLELCLANCSWVDKQEINLFPWDAGTEDGISYKTTPTPTLPRDIIRRISTSFPAHPDSPFFDDKGGRMKELARLYITRQRLYEKTCDPSMGSEDNSQEISGPCRVGPWRDWTPCSVSCGRGTKQQKRLYVNKLEAQINNCHVDLFKDVECVKRCHGQITDVNTEAYCQLTPWSEWSSCSSECDEGTKTRDRTYVNRDAEKYCTRGKYYLPILQDNERCNIRPCDDNTIPQVYEKEGCEMTPWTLWTPCSSTCGKGTKTRRRSRFSMPETVNTIRKRSHRRHIRHRRQAYDDNEDDDDEDDDEDSCQNVKMYEVVECIADVASCDIDPEQAKVICQQPKDPGSCGTNGYTTYFEKWHFETFSMQCVSFNYSGCGGNYNKFDSREDCERACANYGSNPINTGEITVGSQILAQHRNSPDIGYPYDIYSNQNVEEESPPVNCKVSDWSDWSSCNCETGFEIKYRTILVFPSSRGKPCPPKLERKRRCKTQCRYNNK